MANERVDWEWLIRIRLGECTADERAAFERWMREDPSRVELMNSLDALDVGASNDRRRWDTERALARFKQLRSDNPRRRSTPHLTLLRPPRRPRLLPWALSGLAAAALAVAVALFQGPRPQSVEPPSPAKPPRETITAPEIGRASCR